MAEIRIRNWHKWQSYRRDRGKPPWIKVHKRLLLDPNWSQLTDAQRGQLVTMWMIASDRDGVMPTPNGWRGDVESAARMIAKLGFLDCHPDLQLFADLGFIIIDASVTSARRQDDANVTPQCSTGQGSTGQRDDVDAREHEDFAVPQTGMVAGIPSSILPIASIADPTDKQREELTYLAESTGVSLDDMLAHLPHATWTKASARLAIDRYRAIQAKAAQPKTFDQIKRGNSDDAIATVMREISRASD